MPFMYEPACHNSPRLIHATLPIRSTSRNQDRVSSQPDTSITVTTEDILPPVQMHPDTLYDYRLAAPTSFPSPADVEFVLILAETLAFAIWNAKLPLARSLTGTTLNFAENGQNNIILNEALTAAAGMNYTDTVRFMLKHESNEWLDFLKTPLYLAARHGNIDMVHVLIQRLIKVSKAESQQFTAEHGCNRDKAVFAANLHLYRSAIVVRALETTKEGGHEDVYSALLWVFLRGVPRFAGSDPVEALEDAARTRWASLSGMQRLHLVRNPHFPSVLRRSVAQSLQTEGPKDMILIVDSRVYAVHRDVMDFWSDYFSTLWDPSSRCIQLDGGIRDECMRGVIKFIHCPSRVQRALFLLFNSITKHTLRIYTKLSSTLWDPME
ncbi:ankyrin repeat and BTB/POZ domain-containing protein [Aspergillus stella-maris]|uniref:ankyrin repeat and BTB/POZ domain-containing protein n=1 Tax=Aspergillus stella-maris TaxID=1810926 RepID=UPI003CCCC45A